MVLALKTAAKQDVRQSFTGPAGVVTEREGKFAKSIERHFTEMISRSSRADLELGPRQPENPSNGNGCLRLTPADIKFEVGANIQAGPDKHRVQIRILREPIVIQVLVFQQIKMYVAEAMAMFWLQVPLSQRLRMSSGSFHQSQCLLQLLAATPQHRSLR
jgi:hypothetical protein